MCDAVFWFVVRVVGARLLGFRVERVALARVMGFSGFCRIRCPVRSRVGACEGCERGASIQA